VRENDQHFVMSFLDSKFLENKASAFVPWSVIRSSMYPTFTGYILQIRTLCIVCEFVFVVLYLLIPATAFSGCLFVVVIFVE